jgi:hypothetical protein
MDWTRRVIAAATGVSLRSPRLPAPEKPGQPPGQWKPWATLPRCIGVRPPLLIIAVNKDLFSEDEEPQERSQHACR